MNSDFVKPRPYLFNGDPTTVIIKHPVPLRYGMKNTEYTLKADRWRLHEGFLLGYFGDNSTPNYILPCNDNILMIRRMSSTEIKNWKYE